MTMKAGEVVIIILAAGDSSRMGQPKQLLTVKGKPLLQHAVYTALQSKAGKVVVVLGSNAEANEKLLASLPVTIVHHPQWHEGMGSSLQRGVEESLKIFPELAAVLIMVCDQPLLTTSHLKKLIKVYNSSTFPLVASQYHKTLGVPALFDRSLIPELFTLKNNQGAKTIIEKYSHALGTVPFPGGGIDLDTPEDYSKFTGNY